MSIKFIKEDHMSVFKKIESDLAVSNPSMNLSKYKGMDSKNLNTVISKIETTQNRIVENSNFYAYFNDENYISNKLLLEALKNLYEYKKLIEIKEVLVPSYTYYRNVKKVGKKLIGERCTYLGKNRPTNWVKFNENIALTKAINIINHGDTKDFAKIYIELANGINDPLKKITLKHISESTDQALLEIESYCDSRWESHWPWEKPSPYKLRNKIEETKIMRNMSIVQMKGRFDSLVRQLNEGEVEKAEVILQGRTVAEKIQGMVEDLGKLSGEGILQLKDMARSSIGDHAADAIEKSVTGPINQAADVLSKLKVQIEKTLSSLEDMNHSEVHNNDDFGSDTPDENEHDEHMTNNMADEFEENPERPMKRM